MNNIYCVDANGILSEVTPAGYTLRQGTILCDDSNGAVRKFPKAWLHATRLCALSARRNILALEAQREFDNAASAKKRHDTIMNKLVELDIELYDLRKVTV